MKKKIILLFTFLLLSLCITFHGSALADSQLVATLGADLSEEQKTAILRYFGVYGQDIRILTITNQDEREHLGSYVPLEQIGTRTFSCALVRPTTSGGIQVKTANLNWVTSNMIASTLSTSGVVNCQVLAASPFEVSGTGALTGIIMAYESASGTSLDETKKEIATQELITTGNLADQVGQEQATSIVNEIKIQVIEGQATDSATVDEIVDNVVYSAQGEGQGGDSNNLSSEDVEMLRQLANEIAQQQYDYSDMAETLQRVEENVSGTSVSYEDQNTADWDDLTDGEDDGSDDWDEDWDDDWDEDWDDDEELNILNHTDDTALGEGVLFDSTQADVAVLSEPDDAEGDVSADDYGEDFADDLSDEDWDGDAADADWDDDTADDVSDDENDYDDASAAAGSGQSLTFDPSELRIAGDYLREGTEAAAGTGLIRLFAAKRDLFFTGGMAMVTDESGNLCAGADLDDRSCVRSMPMSSEDLAANGWSEGTQILILLDGTMDPSAGYDISISGTIVQTQDLSLADQAPSAEVNVYGYMLTGNYGMELDIVSLNEASVNASVTGTLVYGDEAAFAEITGYDSSRMFIENTALDLWNEGDEIQIQLLAEGTSAVLIDYFDGDYNHLASVSVPVTAVSLLQG